MIILVNDFFRFIASKKPELKNELKQAEIDSSPLEFVRKSFISSFMLSFVLGIVFIGGLLSAMQRPLYIALIAFPLIFFLSFNYFLQLPSVLKIKKAKEINKEIVFATRFLIIETEAGVPLYNCFINMSKTYKHIGKHFKTIVESVNLGTPMEDAINDAIQVCPSKNLQKIFWQILNTLHTGSDVTKPLNSVLEQIIKEQKIEVEEYGRRLNPMAMFYMMVAVIAPSLGTTMLIIFSTFTGFEVGLTVLLSIAVLIGFIQFMFFSFIKSSRPAVEI